LRILANLWRLSLVHWYPGDRTGRYQIHELLRQLADAQLEAVPGEREAVEARHGTFYLALAEAAAEYTGMRQVEWLDRIERDHDNTRAAQERFAECGEVEMELRLVTAAMYFWFIHGYHTEGTERLLHTLARPEAGAPTAVRTRALNGASYLQWVRGHLREAHALFTESVEIARTIKAEAILAFGLCYLGAVVNAWGEYAAAEVLLEESLTIWRPLGSDNDMGLSLMFLGDSALGRSEMDRARASLTQSADLFRGTGNVKVLPYPLRRLGHLALLEHDGGHAAILYNKSMTLNLDVGDRQGVAASLVGMAAVAEGRKDPEQAARFLGAADALVETIQTQLLPFDHEESERITTAVRAQLDAATFPTSWAGGRAMTCEQAVGAASEWAASTIGCAS